jgi:glycosyltransferase involved in cell wall biosynthesis
MEDHTFVIPAYKESPYLEVCINSILSQTVKSEVIITTSTPSVFLEKIAQKYAVKYYVNDGTAKGIANDWNFALSQANTQWVTIAHQDDVYESNYTGAVAAGIKRNADKKILIAFTNYTDLVGNSSRNFSLNALVKGSLLLPFAFSKIIGLKLFKKMILLFGDPICCPSVNLNMAALRGDFKFQEKYTCALDWYAWYQLASRRGAFMYINQKLVRHRIHPGSETTNQLVNGLRQKEELELFELMWGKRMARLIARVYALGHKENLL